MVQEQCFPQVIARMELLLSQQVISHQLEIQTVVFRGLGWDYSH